MIDYTQITRKKIKVPCMSCGEFLASQSFGWILFGSQTNSPFDMFFCGNCKHTWEYSALIWVGDYDWELAERGLDHCIVINEEYNGPIPF